MRNVLAPIFSGRRCSAWRTELFAPGIAVHWNASGDSHTRPRHTGARRQYAPSGGCGNLSPRAEETAIRTNSGSAYDGTLCRRGQAVIALHAPTSSS